MRDNVLMLSTGMQRTGKSYSTFRDMLIAAFTKNRRVLLFDTNGQEFSAKEVDNKPHKIPILKGSITDFCNRKEKDKNGKIIKNWEMNIQRIAPFYPNGMPMSSEDTEKLLIQVLTEFRNGILHIEDFNKLYGDSVPIEISSKLLNLRHVGVDLSLSLQSVGRIVPKILQNCKLIKMHKQLDSIERSKSKLVGEIEIYYIAEKLINKQYYSCTCESDICKCGKRYFYVYIYREEQKIKGAFSPKMFADAIIEYLNDNAIDVKNVQKRVNEKGDPVFPHYYAALMFRAHELFNQYYGNPRTKSPKKQNQVRLAR